MKELSTIETQQISGGCNLGSMLTFLGYKDLGDKVHGFDLKLYDATLGKLFGQENKKFFTDFYRQYENKPKS